MHARRANIVVDLFLRLNGLVPPPVRHNVAKANAISSVFWHLAVDQVPGCYVEFGVATGNSIRSAEVAERRSVSKLLGVHRVRRPIYGFDTFDGFSSPSQADEHPTWRGSKFTAQFAEVQRRFRRTGERVTLFQIDAMSLADEDGEPKINLTSLVREPVAIALFDMDLGEPTERALHWIAPALTDGSVIMFDEFFAFHGDPDRGESGAFRRFLKSHPSLLFREFLSYGDGGRAFQLCSS